ncbi:bifunctional phosphoribosylaminoimidazolecarboxamide formyltransferase/IMP cyclohydrolase [Natronogracilivirga saccharolytica]|uniref:Bifunctional purine biosynthesis protein PurH n=1 Tax=Natronogracilivirga saccharolytica TaxID=2812953 RepID=A0A8J7S6F8_9BACT|nr:bifunctional phosphoribosylaminoimidazolecarboxamide formyltransferase/IMP cyclohydrolase [Natronogracilivirga saccharolytica]MBP3191153.1 bifunctional phosphoribosylaminoimidazolecarboxamide formyltransferase/IMP cyclohydrolase [Natronogracilivirga saccharolytica]
MDTFLNQLADIKVKRALISVFDKSGIAEFARTLHELGIEIISTGGTAEILRENGLKITDVSEVTNFPECLDGRVKTLHPHIHGGLLARPGKKDHADTLADLGIEPFELVVVNLYPFQDAITQKPDDTGHAVENIDIGGPAMIRAAAKNFENACVVTNPRNYPSVTAELKSKNGSIGAAQRIRLASEAFRLTSHYDLHITEKLAKTANAHFSEPGDEKISRVPGHLTISAPSHQTLRYGENPHQSAGVFGNPGEFIECFHGKKLSYNNYLDIDSALQLGADFHPDEISPEESLCAIFKHNIPCGVALAGSSAEAWEQAFATDTVSPFGGVILFNRKVDPDTAKAVDRIFSEIIIAPDFDEDALELLTEKSNRRLVRIKKWPDGSRPHIRTITGGYLWQEADFGFGTETRETVTQLEPDSNQQKSLEFAWKVVKHVKSNAIVYASGQRTIGIGTGQPNRIDASRLAVQKAREFGHSLNKSVLASDAFFPFADGVEVAAESGSRAIIQPGGSIRDDEVIQKADDLGISMIFTGLRHFRH